MLTLLTCLLTPGTASSAPLRLLAALLPDLPQRTPLALHPALRAGPPPPGPRGPRRLRRLHGRLGGPGGGGAGRGGPRAVREGPQGGGGCEEGGAGRGQ